MCFSFIFHHNLYTIMEAQVEHNLHINELFREGHFGKHIFRITIQYKYYK